MWLIEHDISFLDDALQVAEAGEGPGDGKLFLGEDIEEIG